MIVILFAHYCVCVRHINSMLQRWLMRCMSVCVIHICSLHIGYFIGHKHDRVNEFIQSVSQSSRSVGRSELNRIKIWHQTGWVQAARVTDSIDGSTLLSLSWLASVSGRTIAMTRISRFSFLRLSILKDNFSSKSKYCVGPTTPLLTVTLCNVL